MQIEHLILLILPRGMEYENAKHSLPEADMITEREHMSLSGIIGFFIAFIKNPDVWDAVLTAILCSIAVRLLGILWDQIFKPKNR